MIDILTVLLIHITITIHTRFKQQLWLDDKSGFQHALVRTLKNADGIRVQNNFYWFESCFIS